MTDATSMEPPRPDALDLGDVLVDLASAQAHDQALTEFEAGADATGERIVDRAAATFVTWAVRAVSARRVVELGAGGGVLTWWLAGAVGPTGEVRAVTGRDDEARVTDRLRRTGRATQVTVVGTDAADAGASPDHLVEVAGDLDAVVVREVTPALVDGWTTLLDRIRPGGLVLVGEALAEGPPAGRAATLVRDALEDPDLWTSLVPIGSGWLAALKVRSDLAGATSDQLW